MKQIILLSDGDTWESLNEGVTIVDLTDEEYEKILDGRKVAHVLDERKENDGQILRSVTISVLEDEAFERGVLAGIESQMS